MNSFTYLCARPQIGVMTGGITSGKYLTLQHLEPTLVLLCISAMKMVPINPQVSGIYTLILSGYNL